jgi:type I restriction enzyme R subunit
LAVFDILTQAGPDLSDSDKKDIKKIAQSLLETLKQEKLVLDWRKRQNTRADVLYTIEKMLDDELPRSYSTDLYKEKCEQVYEHIFDSYFDNGKSVYDVAS